MKKLLLITLLSILSFAFISRDQHDQSMDHKADSSSAVVANITIKQRDASRSVTDLDTLTLSSKSVIIFILNQEEFDALLEASGEDNDVTKVKKLYDELLANAERTCTNLKRAGIRAEVVSNKVFKFITKDGIEYYNRLEHENADIGVIIFNGESKPLVDTEFMTDTDILELLDIK